MRARVYPQGVLPSLPPSLLLSPTSPELNAIQSRLPESRQVRQLQLGQLQRTRAKPWPSGKKLELGGAGDGWAEATVGSLQLNLVNLNGLSLGDI